MGPGTHVVDRVFKRQPPQSHNDLVALRHDIEYLDKNREPILSDIKAIAKSDSTIEGLAMKLGLTTRAIVDTLEHIYPWNTRISHINGRTDRLNMGDDELIMKLNDIIDEEGWENNRYKPNR
jgi:hypothetical protein